MGTDEQAPSRPGAESSQAAEIRALLLRLLRLVAAEVAAQLPRPRSGEPLHPAGDKS